LKSVIPDKALNPPCESCGGTLSRVGMALYGCDFCGSLHYLDQAGARLLTAKHLAPELVQAELEVMGDEVGEQQAVVDRLRREKREALEKRKQIGGTGRILLTLVLGGFEVALYPALIDRLRDVVRAPQVIQVAGALIALVMILIWSGYFYFAIVMPQRGPARWDARIKAAFEELQARKAIKKRIEGLMDQANQIRWKAEHEGVAESRLGMHRVNCRQCGGSMEVKGEGPLTCPYCGAEQAAAVDEGTAGELAADAVRIREDLERYTAILAKEQEKLRERERLHGWVSSWLVRGPLLASVAGIVLFCLYAFWAGGYSDQLLKGLLELEVVPLSLLGSVYCEILSYPEARREAVARLARLKVLIQAKKDQAPKE
jgi:hypothetical protein